MPSTGWCSIALDGGRLRHGGRFGVYRVHVRLARPSGSPRLSVSLCPGIHHSSHGRRPAHSFSGHEYGRRPAADGIRTASVVSRTFGDGRRSTDLSNRSTRDAHAGAGRSHSDGTPVRARGGAGPKAWRAVRQALFDHAFTGIEAADYWDAVYTDTHAGLQVVVRSRANLTDLVVYTPPDHSAVCLEPYSCATDAFNLEARGIAAGMVRLAPGDSWSTAVDILVRTAAGT